MVFVTQTETERLTLQFAWEKSLDWAENIWQHLEKVYLSWVKKVVLGSILEKEKSFHFWIPWFCEPHNYGSYTHDSWTQHLILLLCPFFTPPQGDHGQTCHPHQQPHLFSSKDPFNLTSYEDFFCPHQLPLNVSSYLLHFPKLPLETLLPLYFSFLASLVIQILATAIIGQMPTTLGQYTCKDVHV